MHASTWVYYGGGSTMDLNGWIGLLWNRILCMPVSNLVVVASYVLCTHILVYDSIISSTILSSSH